MVDLHSINSFPYIRAIAATTNNTQIKIPARETSKITIATKTGIVHFAYEGRDNGTPSGNHLFVTNFGMVEQKWPG